VHVSADTRARTAATSAAVPPISSTSIAESAPTLGDGSADRPVSWGAFRRHPIRPAIA
jgi:hypothetical protein